MAAVRRCLESRHVYLQNEWAEACINFVKEDNEERQLTSLQLNDLVYEQWLMADIQESSAPCLPEGLGNVDVCKLEGYFNLQINSVLNVGESAYSQIQKMKGQDDPEELNWRTNPSEPKLKPSRMLLLELTDGTQTVFGMEYQLIQSLKVTMSPGTKIQVIGPTTCRLGALLLTPSNVKVLGGSVQMLEENSSWNVLHQAIGQDPPERPGIIKTEAVPNEEYNVDQCNIQNNTAIYNNQRPVEKPQANLAKMATVGLGSSEGKFPEYGGQFKQHCSSERTKVKGIVTTNACRDFQAEILSNEELFNDDDDLIAAMADEDYFGNEEDFDMEQIDQLEQGMQDRSKTAATKRKTTCETETIEMDSFGVLCGDYEGDDVFEDDFITNGPPPEDEEGIEVKPLHQRICSKDRSRAIHQSKKAKTSATATTTNTTEFHDSSWKTSSSVSNNSNIQIQGELFANATRLTIPKVDSMLQMSNGLIETEYSSKVTSLDCNAAPFMYLSDILKHLSVSQEYIVRVKAYIATIVSRSNPSSPNWNVIVKLNDGTGTVDADLSEKVLTELLEYPVDEFWREIQEAMKTRNTAVCQRLQKRSELFQRNLASTSCLMDLQFSVDMPRPRVLHLSQTTSADVSAMLRRVSGLL